MTSRRFRTLPLLLPAIALAIALAGTVGPGCSRRSTGSGAGPGDSVALGSNLFAFDYTQATELTLAKDDPRTAERWSATVVRDAGSSVPGWKITSAPEGRDLRDSRANPSLIEHLLDTLRTLQYAEKAPEGTLASFGLASPRFALRWKAGGKTFELLVGNDAGENGGYVLIPGGEKPMIARGAALRMLEHFSDFDSVRQSTLTTFTTDDVDEVTFYRGARKTQYAQREMDEWVDERHRKLKAPVGDILQSLTHLRVKRFLDDPALAAPILKGLERSPTYRIEVKDRQARPTGVRIARIDGKIWASESAREGAAFELYPGTLEHFDSLPK